jgi:nucleoside-diphosphate-sugar epimerase
MRIIITGGSGKAGRPIIKELLAKGHRLLNLDLVPLPPTPEFAAVHTIRLDLTDSGQVFNALTSHYAPTEPLDPGQPKPPDAIIHLGGIPHPLIVADNETFRINTMSCYNVIEAACKLGVPKIVIASSLTVYGMTYCEGPKPYPHFPITEDSPVDPTDPYALSKICCERIAESFASKFAGKVDIYALRIGRITLEDDYNKPMFRSYVEQPEKWAPHGWSYIDVRDLAEICHLAVTKKMGDGYVVMNTVNDEITNFEDARAFLGRVQRGVEIGEMGKRDAPVRNWRVREVLGWKETWNWGRIWEDNGFGK